MPDLSKPFYRIFLIVIYLAAAAVVLNTFMSERGLLGDNERYGFKKMVSFNADRPFAYRVLMPLLVTTISDLTPDETIDNSEELLLEKSPLLKYVQIKDGFDNLTSFQYHVTYILLFITLLLFIIVIRSLTNAVFRPPPIYSDLLPPLAMLVLPMTFIHGGYMYDFPELLLVTTAFLAAFRSQYWLYYICFPLAILNKETAILLILYFAALQLDRLPRKALYVHLSAQILVGGAILLVVRSLMASNPGSGIEIRLLDNLACWFSLSPLTGTFDIYTPIIPIPKGGNILLLFLVAYGVGFKWKEKPLQLRRALIAVSSILLPLFMVAGNRDETRALYLLFPVIYLMFFDTLLGLYKKKSDRTVTP